MNENVKRVGEFVLEGIDARTGRIIFRKRIKNKLTQVNGVMWLRALTGETPLDLEIKYIALGKNGVPLMPGQTTLNYEIIRKPYTKRTTTQGDIFSGVPYKVETVVSFGAGEANDHIKEIGVFCGSGATSAADSGLMLSRVTVDFEKTENMVLNIYRTDKCYI